jgi:hypothetical protein
MSSGAAIDTAAMFFYPIELMEAVLMGVAADKKTRLRRTLYASLALFSSLLRQPAVPPFGVFIRLPAYTLHKPPELSF